MFLYFLLVFLLLHHFGIGDLSSYRCFDESDAYYEQKYSTLNSFLEKILTLTKILLVRVSTIYRAHTDQLDFLNKLKNQFANDPRHLRRVQELKTRVFDEANPNLPGLLLFGHYFRSYFEKRGPK